LACFKIFFLRALEATEFTDLGIVLFFEGGGISTLLEPYFGFIINV